MNKAFIFPGQGSQLIGMGKDFFQEFSVAKSTFEEVDEVLQFKLSDIIFSGQIEDLSITKNTQPALMAVSIAIARVILSKMDAQVNDICKFVAGHSLGEYSALCFAQAISLADTTKLLHIRASSMQEAVPIGKGAMAACLGISQKDLQEMIDNLITQGVCQIANDNTNGQLVISGHVENIDHIVATMKDLGKRAIKLNVSAPFHCNLMKPSEDKMAVALSKIDIKKPQVPVVTNVTAKKTSDPKQIKENLLEQICGCVKWRQTLDYFAEQNIEELVEIGPGKVLTGLAKRSVHNFKLTNISTIQEMDQFLSRL